MEIDKQSNGNTQQTQMRQQLSLVNRMYSFFALQFNGDPAFDHEIGPETTVQLDRFINQRDRLLPLDAKPEVLYLIGEASLVSGFQKPRSQFAVNFDGRADNLGRKVRRAQTQLLWNFFPNFAALP